MIPSARTILSLALPMAGEQFLIFGIALFDTALAGQLGVEHISAQIVVVRWVQFTSVIFSIMSVGGSILVAQTIGREDFDSANDVLSGSLLMALVSGLFVTAIAISFSSMLIGLMGVDTAVTALSLPYLQVMSLSFPLTFMLLSASGCIRGAGDARTPLIIIGLANFVHLFVALILVFGMEYGLQGIAYATIFSRGLGLVLFTVLLLRGMANLRLDRLIPRLESIREIWGVGKAVGGEQLALRLGQLVNLRLITTLGTQLLAAYTVVLNSLSLILLMGLGFMMASLTIIGQQVGADEDQFVYRTSWRMVYVAWAVMGGMSLLFFVVPAVNQLFTNNPDILHIANSGLRIILFGVIFEVVNQVLTGVLRGSGDTQSPMIITTVGHWLIRLPLILIFIHIFNLGLNGVWFAMIIEMAVRAVWNSKRVHTAFYMLSAKSKVYSH